MHGLFGHKPGAFSNLGFSARGGAAASDRLGICHQRSAQRDRTRLVALHRHVGEPVTNDLIGGERPPELLAHLGIFERSVEHDLHDADRLGAKRRERAINRRLDC